MLRFNLLPVVFAFIVMIAIAPSARAVVIWNETGGDLSNVQAAPSTFVLVSGTNSVIGSVTSSGDTQDWVTVNVPIGFQMTQYVNAAYSSSDAQGFTGFNTGSVFTGGVNTSGDYKGWSHFGTGAVNPGFSSFNSVGVNLFPVMNAQSVPNGAQGFTTPLGSGSYSFIIQQTGPALTGYQFDFIVTPVPEPSSLALIGLGGVAALARWRKRRVK